ncbi:scf E3 ubiquitin ligase complex F-box protein grra [Phtheirospermum japonicum]|uniref:Scf E3 ubiquitin ligase complex F-box protein grra n=1 Tax=Phtheirospermum japonicum TaxID=374723 RepID=A0A830CDZ3_9LAMI|nr:scf E3 ubiquitin ligase complex F-box protein grra [Phtheirospermum japonicum]
MDSVLCDELLQEIFHRLPPPSSAAVSLVSRRWHRLLRSSTTSLSLHVPRPHNPATITSFSAFLTQHPFLSSLSISGGGEDPLLFAVASSCPNLRYLHFLSSPVSIFSLYTLSASCIHLSSIAITISRPLSFHWLPNFNSLKSLSLYFTNPSSDTNIPEVKNAAFDAELNLETLSLCGILAGDYGLSSLWKNCKNAKKLKLKGCESLGDYLSFSQFLRSLSNLQELELRTCRSIIDVVLLTLAETCVSLDSLLVYDGGSKEGLLQFLNQSKCGLKRLDLRLPLDLDNTHLIALSENLNFRGLVSLRLQSCCLVTGEGLKGLGRALANGLEELALVNCDVVDREPGLLTGLGQSLRKLRKLDLSYNDMLVDKEIVSMLASCCFLVELRLRGCSMLSDAALYSMVRCCKRMECVDITCCGRIDMDGVEFFVINSPNLRRIEVERSKISEVARRWASSKFMEIVS